MVVLCASSSAITTTGRQLVTGRRATGLVTTTWRQSWVGQVEFARCLTPQSNPDPDPPLPAVTPHQILSAPTAREVRAARL